jgi:hypothetical protein
VWAAATDMADHGYLAGRTAARLHGLDGFLGDSIEFLTTRQKRNSGGSHVVRSTSLELSLADAITIDGVRCLTAERLVLDSPLFDFTVAETENAIDFGDPAEAGQRAAPSREGDREAPAWHQRWPHAPRRAGRCRRREPAGALVPRPRP